MEMDQPVDPSAQQRTIPTVLVDPIPILPSLVIATPADTVKSKSASDKKTHIRRFSAPMALLLPQFETWLENHTSTPISVHSLTSIMRLVEILHH